MQCLEVSGAVRTIYGSLGVKRLSTHMQAVTISLLVNSCNAGGGYVGEEGYFCRASSVWVNAIGQLGFRRYLLRTSTRMFSLINYILFISNILLPELIRGHHFVF